MPLGAPPQAELEGNDPGGSSAHALQVCLLADDVTGACDAAVAFAARGLRTEFAFSPQARCAEHTQVWARSTETRDIAPAEAEAQLAWELQSVPPCGMLFKKIDSAFRGNTMAEIALTVRSRPDAFCVLAPAFPEHGRTSSGGVVRIADAGGVRSLPVWEELQQRGVALALLEAGLTPKAIAQRVSTFRGNGVQAIFCDAQSQEDLHNLVATLQAALPDRGVVWIGSGGLAHALAATIHGPAAQAPPRERRSGDLLFFIGSNHPVTLGQVRALRAHVERSASDTVRIVEVVRGRTSPGEIRAAVDDYRAENTGCLFMTGGDTAALVCRALGIRSIRLEREFAPGLPEGVALGGTFAGAPILLKSGGFGTEDVLCRIAQTIAKTFDSSAFPASTTQGVAEERGGLQ